MTAVYQLMFEALQENPNFVYPAHYGEYMGFSLEHKASSKTSKGHAASMLRNAAKMMSASFKAVPYK